MFLGIILPHTHNSWPVLFCFFFLLVYWCVFSLDNTITKIEIYTYNTKPHLHTFPLTQIHLFVYEIEGIIRLKPSSYWTTKHKKNKKNVYVLTNNVKGYLRNSILASFLWFSKLWIPFIARFFSFQLNLTIQSYLYRNLLNFYYKYSGYRRGKG